MYEMKYLGGAFIINKEKDITSRFVDNFLLREYRFRKVGHLGTLDPFAEGVLVVFVNEGTKLIPFFEDLDKEYIATMKLGISTDTGDKDGTIIKEEEPPLLVVEDIKQYLQSLVGINEQVPPMYSALKKDGVPLYKLAREGVTVERKPRQFYIYDIDLLDYSNNEITYRVRVSKGTYIRTLSEDIAKHFNTVAHLTKLVRTQTGPFTIENSVSMRELSSDNLLNIETLFSEYPSYEVNEEELLKVKRAEPLSLQFVASYVLIKYKDKSLAIYSKDHDTYKFKRGLN